MEQKILKKNEIGKLYKEFESEYNFYAPINQKGNIAFEKVENPEDIVLDYLNSKIPPKSVLFPQSEVLFEFDQKGIIYYIRPQTGLGHKIGKPPRHLD